MPSSKHPSSQHLLSDATYKKLSQKFNKASDELKKYRGSFFEQNKLEKPPRKPYQRRAPAAPKAKKSAAKADE
jgi:hypothetical protein